MIQLIAVSYLSGVFALGGFGWTGCKQSRVNPWHMALIVVLWPILVPYLMIGCERKREDEE